MNFTKSITEIVNSITIADLLGAKGLQATLNYAVFVTFAA